MIKVDTNELQSFIVTLVNNNNSIFNRINKNKCITDFDIILNTADKKNILKLNLYGSINKIVKNTYSLPLQGNLKINKIINFTDIKSKLYNALDFPNFTNISLRFFKHKSEVEAHTHPQNPQIFCYVAKGNNNIFGYKDVFKKVNRGDMFTFNGGESHYYSSIESESILLLIALTPV